MYKCLHGLAPDYLTRLCVRVATVHGRPRLRSSDNHQLLIPRTHTVTLGPCAFNTSGPASWNALPWALKICLLTFSGCYHIIYQPLMIPNCPGAITLDTLVFISGHQDRLPMYRAFNAVLGKVGRIASPDVVVQLVKTSVCQYYAMVLRYVLSINLILALFSMLWITVFVRYSMLN